MLFLRISRIKSAPLCLAAYVTHGLPLQHTLPQNCNRCRFFLFFLPFRYHHHHTASQSLLPLAPSCWATHSYHPVFALPFADKPINLFTQTHVHNPTTGARLPYEMINQAALFSRNRARKLPKMHQASATTTTAKHGPNRACAVKQVRTKSAEGKPIIYNESHYYPRVEGRFEARPDGFSRRYTNSPTVDVTTELFVP